MEETRRQMKRVVVKTHNMSQTYNDVTLCRYSKNKQWSLKSVSVLLVSSITVINCHVIVNHVSFGIFNIKILCLFVGEILYHFIFQCHVYPRPISKEIFSPVKLHLQRMENHAVKKKDFIM